MLLVLIAGEIANITYTAWNACKRYCRDLRQEDNNIPYLPQNDDVAPLMDEAEIVQPNPAEAESARFRDWQRDNERAVINARQAEEKYNAEHPYLEDRAPQDLAPREREEMERFRADERWEASRLAILTRAAENRAAQHDADIAAIGDLEVHEDVAD